MVLFSCNDVPGLDSRSSDTCTSLAVDQAGAIWLAGQQKGKTYNLVKVLAGPQAGSGWQPIGSSGYSAYTWASGRPLLLDLTPVDGESAVGFTGYGQGILGLEQRKTVELFPADGTLPRTIGSGKRDWGLAGNEQLQDLTLWQPKDAAGQVTGSYVLVTTDRGRVLMKDTGSSSAASQALAAIPSGASACNAEGPSFAIRSSAKSGYVYLTNRNYCTVTAYQPSVSNAWSSVKTLTTGMNAPEGLTIAPGISINLANCTTDCTLVDGAKISAVNLSSTESGMTLFQVKGVPDCRYVPTAEACGKKVTRSDGTRATTIVSIDSSGTAHYLVPGDAANPDPATEYLNVTPMLPGEITSLYDDNGVPPQGLPDLLISPQYRGQATQDFVFQAFFAVVEPGVTFTGTFGVEYDVAKLVGAASSLGCTPASNSLTDLLDWDLMTKVSESYKSVGGKYVDTLLNTGCGSSRGTNFGFSLLPYDLEITPDTSSGTTRVIHGDDAVFARLVHKLYADLGDITANYACKTADSSNPADSPPISSGLCSTLMQYWTHGEEELDECLEDAFETRWHSDNRDCQDFESQFQGFKGILAVAGPNGPDPANRKGELAARSKVIDYLFRTRFLPSVPAGGF